MYTVKNTIDNSEETLNSMKEVNEHIASEIKWHNSPDENKNGNGYTADDFIID